MEITLQNIWKKSRLFVKALTIGIIVLILQIPVYYVNDIIKEREARQKDAVTEVSNRWAGKQNITGPVIVLPYWEPGSDGKQVKHYANFLPDQLTINSSLTPQERYRGIYKIMLYTANIKMKGSFSEIKPEKLMLTPDHILWNEVFLKMKISDTKGLKDELKINWKNKVLTLSPQISLDRPGETELAAPLDSVTINDLKDIKFSTEFNINGSEQILYTPIGKSTTVTLSSSWPDPSFTGNILPQSSQISKNGFTASWQSFKHNRNFPQEWKDGAYVFGNQTIETNSLSNAAFGADILIPVNAYQKTTRSVKYSFLCILLTFAAFFIVENTNKKFIHPFQYGLIGIALILFYTLLLSFSEYINFNGSYLIASIATIALIAWFVKGLLSSAKLALVLSVVLILIYSYVFTILQLQDYALIVGSVGLFIALAIIMYFSKKIQSLNE
ncbi:MAG TPA: cell envelope integrity protein CreD [Flavisolibacter sp.]|nr:cell envelope integrity protein CreD [Flavisolibacter sp.]